MSNLYDVLIIGGGPAGLAAGMYASRSKLKTALLEKNSKHGGQAATTMEMENYPGYPESSGPDLTKAFADHADKFGCDFLRGMAQDVDLESDPKVIKTKDAEYLAKTVIIATGAEPRTLGLTGEGKYRGRGVSYCATCDADFYTDLDVLVLGNGDSAVEEALYLTKFCNKVTIVVIHEEGKMDATKIIQERAYQNPKIDFIWNSVIEEIKGDDLVTGAVVKNIKNGELSEVNADGVFIFVGTVPKSDFVQGKVEMTDRGYVMVDKTMETSIPGVFAAGDVTDKYLRQVVTACADGAIAATAAGKFIEEEEGFHLDVLNPSQEKPVLVAFWSPAVEASMKTISVVDQVLGEDAKVKFVSVDVYKNARISNQYYVKEIPTLLLFEKGEVTQRIEGLAQEADLRNILSK